LVERQPSKLNVASSSLVSRSNEISGFQADLRAFCFLNIRIMEIFIKWPGLDCRFSGFQGEHAIKEYKVVIIWCERVVINMTKKFWTRIAVIAIIVFLGVGLFIAFSAEPADDMAYFPLETGNHWAYRSVFFDNTQYREDLIVNEPDKGTLRLIVFNNGDPLAEIQFQRNKKGLFKAKEISGTGVSEYKPVQLSLASKLKVGASWKWKSANGKGQYTSKVQAGGKITVPAGTFDTILVHTNGVSESGEAYVDNTWYAKGVGYVKSIVTIRGKKKVDELAEYTLAKKSK
jgi:hypothetical protein